jgi:hypothetical protein
MAFERRVDGTEGQRPEPVTHLEERRVRAGHLATGTLACPLCDAPVALAGGIGPADRLGCPYCDHSAVARDFLSLAAPPRPARVAVRVIPRRRVTR